MNLQVIKQAERLHYDVLEGSTRLGCFWFANGTIYTHASNNEGYQGTDIGLMETTDAGKCVYYEYHRNRINKILERY